MKRLFGTDGIRAVAGKYPLDSSTVRRFGAALAVVLGDGKPVRVALGRDTRESGPWLCEAVTAGLRSVGSSSIDAGLISTPGLAHVVKECGYDAGVMISASHNPYCDNGLKVFSANGSKLPDALEASIERSILDDGIADPGPSTVPVDTDHTLVRHYISHLEQVIRPKGRLEGMSLVLDCANGSACEIAPEVFQHHGARIETLGTEPDGRNINLDCGSLHLDGLAQVVRDRGFDLGLGFDGDADRCLAVDRKGRVVDGDHLLYITGRQLKRKGKLRGDRLVATIMSNFWLEEWLGREGIGLERAPVGDKYVLERMVEHDLALGGEQSGHIIYRDLATTGDGILSGLMLVDTLLDDSESLDSIMDEIVPYPQVLLNVRVKDKPDLREHPAIGPVVERIESELDGMGRIVLRYSGTEPLARVMLEGKNLDDIQRHADQLVGVIQRELGA